jgi:GH43 family beta-xylosidase
MTNKILHQRTTRILLGLITLFALGLAIYFLYPAQQPVVSPPGMFRNPLNNSGPDPWMTYYDDNYYLATTTWGGPLTGLTMRKASTIAGLKSVAPQKIWQDWTSERCCNFWAPEFFLLNGPNGPHWYGYYSGGPSNCCDYQRIHVIESSGTDPMGPYIYKGQLKTQQMIGSSMPVSCS